MLNSNWTTGVQQNGFHCWLLVVGIPLAFLLRQACVTMERCGISGQAICTSGLALGTVGRLMTVITGSGTAHTRCLSCSKKDHLKTLLFAGDHLRKRVAELYALVTSLLMTRWFQGDCGQSEGFCIWLCIYICDPGSRLCNVLQNQSTKSLWPTNGIEAQWVMRCSISMCMYFVCISLHYYCVYYIAFAITHDGGEGHSMWYTIFFWV